MLVLSPIHRVIKKLGSNTLPLDLAELSLKPRHYHPKNRAKLDDNAARHPSHAGHVRHAQPYHTGRPVRPARPDRPVQSDRPDQSVRPAPPGRPLPLLRHLYRWIYADLRRECREFVSTRIGAEQKRKKSHIVKIFTLLLVLHVVQLSLLPRNSETIRRKD